MKSLLTGQVSEPVRHHAPKLQVASKATNSDASEKSAPSPERVATRPERVAIILGAYNGEEFIGPQLESILAQTHGCWELHVSDDGSTDRTLEIVEAFRAKAAQHIAVRRGPQRGATANFLATITDATIEADYFAYCDQDDVWYPDRLARGVGWLRSQPRSTPALWCSRTEIVNRDGSHLGYSPLFGKPPSFGNALVQNIGGGNTMLMNAVARDLLLQVGMKNVVAHDWWTYKVVAGAGGSVFYDPRPSLKYRQHDRNQVGANNSWRASLKRIKMIAAGRFAEWSEVDCAALSEIEPLLTAFAVKQLRAFNECRRATFWRRPIFLLKSGVYRQSLRGNIALASAVMFGKL